MGMSVNAKEFLRDLQSKKPTRSNVSLYLDLEILARFKRACGDAPYGKVLEKFMVEYADSAEPTGARAPSPKTPKSPKA